MAYVKIEPIDPIGLPNRKNRNPIIMSFTNPAPSWIIFQTLCDHKSNAVPMKTIATHSFGRCIEIIAVVVVVLPQIYQTSYFIFLLHAGDQELFQIWRWCGNCPKHYIQLQFNFTKSI